MTGTDPFIDTLPFIGVSSVTTLWLHFESYQSSSTYGPRWVRLYNSTGQEVAYVGTSNGGSSTTLKFFYWNGTAFVGSATTFGMPTSGTLVTLDLKIVCGVSGSWQWYQGGTLLDSGAISDADCDNIARVRFIGQGSTGRFSQIMGADFDTRDCKYMQKLANANGANTDGTGSYTDIDEVQLSDADAIVLPATGNKKTFTKASYTLPGGYVIGALCVGARGRVSGGTVTDGQMIVRSGGTDYFSGNLVYTGGYEPRGHLWETDPATAAAFTATGFNNAEFGLKGV